MIKLLKTPSVMVIEDDRIVAEDISEVLKDLGYGVSGIFDSGELAIEQANILKPDMILMDIRLRKNMDGIEAAKQIYKRLRIPSIFLTAYADEETLKRVTAFGPFGYVLKPFQGRELKAAIDIALNRNRTEKILEQSKFNFQDIVGKMQDGILIFDRGGDIRFMNPSAKLLLGDQVTGLVQDLLRELFEMSLVHEVEVLDPHEQKRILEVKVAPYKWQGDLVYLGALRDVTERKEAQKKLEVTEKNIRRLIDHNVDAMIVLDENGTVLFANPSAQKIFGRELGELLGHQFGYPISEEKASEIQVFRKSGDLVIAEIRMVKTDWEDRVCYLASIRDITEQKKMTEQFLQSQKMEAFGKLAGGVAHDFNNLLSVIKGYSEFLLDKFAKDEKARFFTEEILSSANRAARLTSQLLAFSRRQVIAPKVFNLNVLIEDMNKMFMRLIGEDIELTANLAKNLGMIKIDPGQMEQILLNLVVNARDAMPKGGKLYIETSNVKVTPETNTHLSGILNGEYIVLKIQDTGSGIPKEVQKNIFDPFFTTKGLGKGTGLGLSTCHAVVKGAKGAIEVVSEVGKGATFEIYLPACKEPNDLLLSEKKSKKIPKGTETILLVEDDEGLRRLAMSILSIYGYKMLEASGAREALSITEKSGQSIDLIVTDVVMPGMSGREMVKKIKQTNQKVKVLFVSGYTDDMIVRHGVFDKQIDFLQKPFSKASLAHKVRDVLDK